MDRRTAVAQVCSALGRTFHFTLVFFEEASFLVRLYSHEGTWPSQRAAPRLRGASISVFDRSRTVLAIFARRASTQNARRHNRKRAVILLV